MNTLSWLIYAAGVLDSLAVGITMVFIASLIAVLGAWIGRLATSGVVMSFDYPGERHPDGTSDYQRWMNWVSATRRKALYVVPIAIFLAGTFIPSSRTVWLIAASEAGEQIVTSPDTIEMMTDLKAIIKKRLRDELAE